MGQPLVVNKWGNVGVSLEAMSPAIQTMVVFQARELINELEGMGLRPFVVGGTLLGAVRSGKILPHDDDADIAYLSRHTHPADVAREAFEIGHKLESLGYEIKRHSATHMQLLFRGDGGYVTHYIDVFSAFFTTDGNINQPFHVRAHTSHSQMLPFGNVSLDAGGTKVTFPAPADPAHWLEINYDTHWRTPLPGFQLITPEGTRRRFESWFGSFNSHRDFWDQFFGTTSPSSAEQAKLWSSGRSWIVDECKQLTSPALIDLGCGQGDLTLNLAAQRSERRVIGVDYSATALRLCNDQSRRTPDGSRAAPRVAPEFVETNLYRISSIALPRQLGITTSFDVVANHLVEQLNHRGRPQVWRLMRMALRSGGQARFTFHSRHVSDVTIADPTGWHLTTEQLIEEAKAFGLGITAVALSDHSCTEPRAPMGASVHLLSEQTRSISEEG
jgi:SAM-dependent methyltransferase